MAVLGDAAVSHERGTRVYDLSLGPPQAQPGWRCTHGGRVGVTGVQGSFEIKDTHRPGVLP